MNIIARVATVLAGCTPFALVADIFFRDVDSLFFRFILAVSI